MNNLTILIVDDEEGIRNSLSMYFELEGYKVLKAKSGNEGLEICSNNHVDIVLSDVRMPNGDGLSLLKSLKSIDKTTPTVVLMTGFAETTREEVQELGGVDLITKPIDFNLFEKFIQGLV